MRVLDALAVVLMLGFTLVMAQTYAHAFINGGRVIVDINGHNETWWELPLVTVCLIIIVWRLPRVIRKTLRG